ncbi:MAG: CoA-binding protein [Thermoanaerobaculum sp.]
MSTEFCEFPLANASEEEIKAILQEAKTVAVVGLSDNPERESYQVAAYLKTHGYRIIPVNPNVQEVLGERAYPTLDDIPKHIQVDVVDIFRRPEFIPEIVNQAIARGAKAIWMQKGLAHNAAADNARAAGLAVVMDRCMMVEHRRLLRG